MRPAHKTLTRAASILLVLSLAAWSAPAALAREPEAPASILTAPPSLQAASDLLMFGSNDLVDTCNTFPVRDDVAALFETWGAWGDEAGAYSRVTHDGEEVAPEMLERRLLESENEGWTQVFEVAKECAKAGGWCACASLAVFSGRAVFCAACCPSGTAPFCVCDGLYAYAACGCYQL